MGFQKGVLTIAPQGVETGAAVVFEERFCPLPEDLQFTLDNFTLNEILLKCHISQRFIFILFDYE